MKNVVRFIATFFLFVFITTMACAQSPLASMPLNINVGVTKSSEVADKGICLAQVKTADSVSHCIRYSMQDNKYGIYCSRDGVILKISFLAVSHHVLPQAWADLGLKLAISYRYKKNKTTPAAGAPVNGAPAKPYVEESGNSQQQVLDIITANGATNISRKTSYSSDYQLGEHISFTIGKLQYTAEFIKWVKPKWCLDCPTYTEYDNGLVSIEVTEVVN